jgi:poly-gamma-glutamate capsule biosynthesis protein CapA/YwtB (metallophosphatase superfamily)
MARCGQPVLRPARATLQPTPALMRTLTLCLGGDVMTGRGIDQIQARTLAPQLYEAQVHDARDYVRLAEQAHGRIPAPVSASYIWGDALAEMDRRLPALRLVNLETAATTSMQAWPDKGVHYRMHPANMTSLSAAQINACSLANNHVLDWGRPGLTQTLHTLRQAGIHSAGAGIDEAAAQAPAVLPLGEGRRLLMFSWATLDCGVPASWGATPVRSGVALLPDLKEADAQRLTAHISAFRQAGDRVLVSLHWGNNWGMDIPEAQRLFAQRLIELGAADLVHGHSSHHARPMEVYRGCLILYGCGDLINDYEGITHPAPFDPSLVCLYFVKLDADTGQLQQLEVVPFQLRRFQLKNATHSQRQKLRAQLDAACQPFNTSLRHRRNGSYLLNW